MKETLKNLKSFWRIVIESKDTRFNICYILNIITSAALPFPPMILSKQIFDCFGMNTSINELAFIVFVWVSVSLGLYILDAFLEEGVRVGTERLIFKLASNFSTKSMHISYELQSHSQTMEMRELAQKLFDGGVFSSMVQTVKPIVVSVIRLITIAAMFFRLDVIIIATVLSMSIINTIANNRSKKIRYKAITEMVPISRRVKYLQRIASLLEYGKEMRVNSFEEMTTQKIDEGNKEGLKFMKKVYHSDMNANRFAHVTNAIQECVVYLILGHKVLVKKTMSVGDFSLYFNAVNTFKAALITLMSEIIDLRINGLYMGHFLSYMGLPNEDRELVEKISVPEMNELTFEKVSFRYPGQTIYSIKDVSFTIRRGEKVAFVGTNGAGKTTIVKLMLRLYKPTEGRILLNGIDINKMDYDEYLRQFAVVFQDYKLFAYTIRENICKNEQGNDTRLDSLMEEVGLSSRIAKLSKGYETNYSREFDESGVEFSGGESQKLAIARAHYKNSQIVIMDEPTSAMDPLAEADVYRNFDSLTRGKTAVYISHRLSSCRFCDTIYTMSDGVILECGSHDELLLNNSLYAQMFQAQAQYYIESSEQSDDPNRSGKSYEKNQDCSN